MDNPEIGHIVSINGIETNIHLSGDGEPVLLIHGSGPGVSAYANWRKVLPELSQNFYTLAPDMVGFGYSSKLNQPFELSAFVNHLLSILDHFEIPQVSLIGNSFGGALALHLAKQCPNRVKRLILMGSVGSRFALTEGLDAVWGYQPSISNMRHLLDIFAFSRELVTDELAELRYNASIREGVQESFSAMFPAPRQRWIDAMALTDEELMSISCPSLLVHGINDQVIPITCSKHLDKTLPNSELLIFEQCGHWVQIEKADEFTRAVKDFIY
ncbi:alpha/beta hydrolase [Neptuniibacter sp.]|uniref:alpha/beta fold hydrolase n=1 Tax=Neptuniibacter sp. TaxID=1962643 RepID=UPI00262C9F01|nr:alpha/beta hydrolase [Neptuniibacter sp.]MCP4595416.1 alpha/beta fold hydrolase [Neptuniibacter sp.]